MNVADIAMRDATPGNVHRISLAEANRRPATRTDAGTHSHALLKADREVKSPRRPWFASRADSTRDGAVSIPPAH